MEVLGKFGVDNLWILHMCSVTSTVVCMSLALWFSNLWKARGRQNEYSDIEKISYRESANVV
jgi:hypothetical protein